MRDTVFVRGLEGRAILGVNEWERHERQIVRVDLDLATDAVRAAAQDDITLAVNYRSVSKAVLELVEGSSFFLVETLAERIAQLVRERFGIAWVRVRVSKPGAVRFSTEVGVEVERGSRG